MLFKKKGKIMEYIRIDKNDMSYEIRNIDNISRNLLKIEFLDSIPEKWGSIALFTAGGFEATTLTGYNTLYRQDGMTVWLSNDGSVYQEPEPLPEPEPHVPSLGELQVAKKLEVSEVCQSIIYTGINVTLSDGNTEHYALTEHDQLNLFGKQAQLAVGATQAEYHADGQPCRYYSAADMQSIIQAAMWHVSYHTTYCNAINMWIAGCKTAEELQAVFYGADVPEEYQSDVLKAYLAEIASLAGGSADASDPV